MPEALSFYKKRHTALLTDRSSWDSHWQELADFIMPRRLRLQKSERNRGTKRNNKIVNNTATRAKRVMQSGMMAGLTSPSRPWFRLSTPDPELKEFPTVRQWLADVQEIMMEIFARSNLYNVLAASYGDLGVFGTASMIIEPDEANVLRGYLQPIGSYALTVSGARRVNGMYRETSMPAIELVKRWPKTASREAQQAAKETPFKYINLLHVIEPNEDRKPDLIGAEGMAISSVWMELEAQNDNLLSAGGYNEMPMMAPRWEAVAEDTYGECPGMESLGDIKGLQTMERLKLRAINKIVDPPMNAPGSMRAERKSLLPADVNYVDPGASGQKFEPAYVIDPKIVMMDTELARHENRINSSFFADLFLLIANSQTARTEKTAREVQELHDEKMLQLGPVVERLQDELLDPLIDRTFAILNRAGLLPEPPSELEGSALRVEYISVLAQAQKLVSTVNVERVVAFAADLAAIWPEAPDNINIDEAVNTYAELVGVPVSMIREEDDRARLRSERQEAAAMQEAQQQADVAKTGAQAVNEAAQAGGGGPDGLDQLLRGAGVAPGLA